MLRFHGRTFNIYFTVESDIYIYITQYYEGKSCLPFDGDKGYTKATLRYVTRTWPVFFSHASPLKLFLTCNGYRTLLCVSYFPIPVRYAGTPYRCFPSGKGTDYDPCEMRVRSMVFQCLRHTSTQRRPFCTVVWRWCIHRINNASKSERFRTVTGRCRIVGLCNAEV